MSDTTIIIPPAQRLRRWRIETETPQRLLAARCATDTATISRIETGRALPTLRVACLLESITGIPASSWTGVTT